MREFSAINELALASRASYNYKEESYDSHYISCKWLFLHYT